MTAKYHWHRYFFARERTIVSYPHALRWSIYGLRWKFGSTQNDVSSIRLKARLRRFDALFAAFFFMRLGFHALKLLQTWSNASPREDGIKCHWPSGILLTSKPEGITGSNTFLQHSGRIDIEVRLSMPAAS